MQNNLRVPKKSAYFAPRLEHAQYKPFKNKK